LGNPAFERSGLTNVPAIDFALPLREQDSADLDERIYGPFESRLLVKAATAVGMAPEDALRGSHIKPDQHGRNRRARWLQRLTELQASLQKMDGYDAQQSSSALTPTRPFHKRKRR